MDIVAESCEKDLQRGDLDYEKDIELHMGLQIFLSGRDRIASDRGHAGYDGTAADGAGGG